MCVCGWVYLRIRGMSLLVTVYNFNQCHTCDNLLCFIALATKEVHILEPFSANSMDIYFGGKCSWSVFAPFPPIPFAKPMKEKQRIFSLITSHAILMSSQGYICKNGNQIHLHLWSDNFGLSTWQHGRKGYTFCGWNWATKIVTFVLRYLLSLWLGQGM